MKTSYKFKSLLQIIILIAALLIINRVFNTWYFKIDLTAEKRFTLSDNTVRYLNELENEVLVKVYLHGDLNVGFKKLSVASEEMLNEFSEHAKELDYRFIDPNAGNREEKKAFLKALEEKGLPPYPVMETAEDGRQTQSYVFPYAVIRYQDREWPINLLEHVKELSGEENLNRSIESLEYKFINALRKITATSKPRIAFLEGHGELDELDVIDITRTLSQNYEVERGQLSGDAQELNVYKLLIVAKPQKVFSERDKFIIDQYLMQGGRILWLIDAVNITLDSLRRAPQTMGFYSDLNLNDQLFKYGFRINPVLVEDIQAGRIPLNMAPPGSPAKFVPVPWLYNPLLSPSPAHTVSRNLNLVRAEFCSVIDTVGDNLPILRTPLLQTSRFTRLTPTPAMVSLASVNERPKKETFNKSHLPVAFAASGQFASVFANRPVPQGIRNINQEVKTYSRPTRMILVADGDLIRNDVKFKDSNPRILPLGFDEVTNQTFGNKQFIANAVDYLCDDEGWMDLRSRSFALRLLDQQKLSDAAGLWKWINVLVPIGIVVLFGFGFVIYRKRRYSS